MNDESIAESIKDHILQEFLRGEDRNALKGDTALISSKILDSLATLKLVSFMETEFGIALEAHEVDIENLDTIDLMVNLVREKQAGR